MSAQTHNSTRIIHTCEQPQNSLGIPYLRFFKAIPAANAIYGKHKKDYSDEYSNWLGRWIQRAEESCKNISDKDSDSTKQQIADQLIEELVKKILVSPLDGCPFQEEGDKMPILFEGLPYPDWFLRDLFDTRGTPDELKKTKLHLLIHEMLLWKRTLFQPSSANDTESKDLASCHSFAGPLTNCSSSNAPTYFNNKILAAITPDEHSAIVQEKLKSYEKARRLALQFVNIHKGNEQLKKETELLAKKTNSMRIQNKLLNVRKLAMRSEQKQETEEQIKGIRKAQIMTKTIINNHFQSTVNELNQTQQQMQELLLDCKKKEAEVLKWQEAQRKLKV